MNSLEKIDKFTEVLRRELHFALNKGEEMELSLRITPKANKLGKKIGDRRVAFIPRIVLDSSIGELRKKLRRK